MEPYRAQAGLFKAMAHPVRLHILEILAQGEACVCHITTVLGQRQPYVSQQLMALREASLVLDRRDGNIVYYSLADARVAQAIQLTRKIWAAIHEPLEFAPIPEPPLLGCPCPHCEAQRCCD